MTEQRDDDALSWAGDDDPTLDPAGDREVDRSSDEALEELAPQTPTAPQRPAPVSGSVTPAPSGSVPPAARERSTSVVDAATSSGEREQMSSTMLVTLGIFGGVFLLYSVGWLISAFRPDAAVPSDTVGQFMFNLGQGLAVAAGPVWMAATLWLTRRSTPWVRIAMLLLGVLLVLPWPFLRGV
ncbi:MAG TPA: hypothetical protein VNJ54_14205 [Plantibacter sp.]|uniref:hypothetical protein n=1 Tax=unclassified Plantibacter TaxID=2624265 RepID=UPI002CE62A48|nr:hypothetical protein [Plantibacter sp.]